MSGAIRRVLILKSEAYERVKGPHPFYPLVELPHTPGSIKAATLIEKSATNTQKTTLAVLKKSINLFTTGLLLVRPVRPFKLLSEGLYCRYV